MRRSLAGARSLILGTTATLCRHSRNNCYSQVRPHQGIPISAEITEASSVLGTHPIIPSKTCRKWSGLVSATENILPTNKLGTANTYAASTVCLNVT